MKNSMATINIVPLDVKSGLTSAKNEAVTMVKFIVENVAIPVIAAVLVGLLIFNIAKAVKKHHGAEPYGDNLIGIGIVVIVLAVVISAPNWMWSMI